MAKLTRRLTIKLVPISKGNFAVTFTDGTTRSEDGHRHHGKRSHLRCVRGGGCLRGDRNAV